MFLVDQLEKNSEEIIKLMYPNPIKYIFHTRMLPEVQSFMIRLQCAQEDMPSVILM